MKGKIPGKTLLETLRGQAYGEIKKNLNQTLNQNLKECKIVFTSYLESHARSTRTHRLVTGIGRLSNGLIMKSLCIIYTHFRGTGTAESKY